MLRMLLRSISARKLRLLLTAVAVVVGVSFVSGTYVLTDSLDTAFRNLFTKANENVDVVVRAAKANDERANADPESPAENDPNTLRVPGSVVAQINAIDGVDSAVGVVRGTAQVFDDKGEPVGGSGPPTFGTAWQDRYAKMVGFTITKGRDPRSADEVLLDADTARKAKATVGDRLTVAFEGGRDSATYTVIGIFELPTGTALGATFAAFSPTEADRRFRARGRVDEIYVFADDGISNSALKARIDAELPKQFEALTGKQDAQATLNEIQKGIGFLRYATLGFAAISLFVAAFTIFNTFSILIAQRVRELGLLRALGATRGQIARLVVGEAAIVGLLGAALGILGGILVAFALQALLRAVQVPIPEGDLTLLPRTVVVSLLVGVIVTCVAALVPAIRAGRISPMQAMRGELQSRSSSRLRRVIVSILKLITTIGGGLLIALGLFGGYPTTPTLSLVGFGFLVLIVGITLTGTVFVRPLVLVLGAPLRWLGVAGMLASRNAERAPRRTVSTAAALMIGLGLASFAAIFTQSASTSFGRQIDRTIGADLTLTNAASGGARAYLPPEIATRVRGVDGVANAVGVRSNSFRVKDGDKELVAVSGDQVDSAFKLELLAGSLNSFGPGKVLVSETFADTYGYKLGRTITVHGAGKKRTQKLQISAIYRDTQISGAIIVPESAFAKLYPPQLQLDSVVLVDAEKGADIDDVRAAIRTELAAEKFVRVQDAGELKEQVEDQINQFLGLLYGLLFLAVLIAVIGIVNTLALSVFERTREIGLLRAVGMSRRQVRRMVRGESILVALIGGVMGIALGVSLGWALILALKDEGLIFDLPVPTVIGVVILSVAVGVIAGALPARRAARLDVLEAVASE